MGAILLTLMAVLTTHLEAASINRTENRLKKMMGIITHMPTIEDVTEFMDPEILERWNTYLNEDFLKKLNEKEAHSRKQPEQCTDVLCGESHQEIEASVITEQDESEGLSNQDLDGNNDHDMLVAPAKPEFLIESHKQSNETLQTIDLQSEKTITSEREI